MGQEQSEAPPEDGNQRINDVNSCNNASDTIPPKVKEHFFHGKTMPDLCKEYQVVGFDADHCIVKYNM